MVLEEDKVQSVFVLEEDKVQSTQRVEGDTCACRKPGGGEMFGRPATHSGMYFIHSVGTLFSNSFNEHRLGYLKWKAFFKQGVQGVETT